MASHGGVFGFPSQEGFGLGFACYPLGYKVLWRQFRGFGCRRRRAPLSEETRRKWRFDFAGLQQLAFGCAHALGAFGVAHAAGGLVQLCERQVGLQVLLRSRQRFEFFVGRGIIAGRVTSLALAARIHADGGKSARAVIVQVGVQMRRVKLLNRFGILAWNVALADQIADHRAILAFHQRVVLSPVGTRFGELDQQFF